MTKVGACVSMLMLGVVPAPPSLPAASVYEPEATVMLAGVVLPAVGVKVAVRVKPVPVIAPKVPPVTSTSPLAPSQANERPGSSLKLKVIVAV